MTSYNFFRHADILDGIVKHAQSTPTVKFNMMETTAVIQLNYVLDAETCEELHTRMSSIKLTRSLLWFQSQFVSFLEYMSKTLPTYRDKHEKQHGIKYPAIYYYLKTSGDISHKITHYLFNRFHQDIKHEAMSDFKEFIMSLMICRSDCIEQIKLYMGLSPNPAAYPTQYLRGFVHGINAELSLDTLLYFLSMYIKYTPKHVIDANARTITKAARLSESKELFEKVSKIMLLIQNKYREEVPEKTREELRRGIDRELLLKISS